MKISKRNTQNNYDANILFMLVAFPYISIPIINIGSDIQPYTIIYVFLLILILIVKREKLSLPYPLWIICLILFYATILYFINADFVFGLRSLAGYISIFLIAVASYLTFKHLNLKAFFLSISIWMIFGIIQLLFKKDFGYNLIVRMSTSPNRGVTSLAVEPSFYAIMCMFFLILNEIFYQRNKYESRVYLVIIFILCFQIFISYSGMGLLLLSIFFIVKIFEILLQKMTIRGIIRVSLCAMGSFIIFWSFTYFPLLQITRAGQILSKFIINPMELLFSDASMADRASHIVVSFYSLIYSNGLGLGLGTWGEHCNLLISSAGGWVEKLANVNFSTGGRIMSGWGTAVYELGVVGMLLILVYLWLILMASRRIQNKKVKANLTGTMIIVFIMLLMAVPLAMPFFGYILGVYFYYIYNSLGLE